MPQKSTEPDVDAALREIDELIASVLPQVSITQSPSQQVSMTGVTSIGNGGDGIHISNEIDLSDIQVDAHYEVVKELADVAQLVDQGLDENSGIIESKLEKVSKMIDAPEKVASIAASLALFL